MLVLSRRTGQAIGLWISGEKIAEVVLVSVYDGKARIGIKANRSVHILRDDAIKVTE